MKKIKTIIVNGEPTQVEEETTIDELIALQKHQIDSDNSYKLSPNDKLAILVNSIETILPEGATGGKLPFKLGYKWVPHYDGSAIVWELVEDPNAIGLESNPIVFAEGMPLLPNAFYLHEDKKYVYVGLNGTATTWDEVKGDMEPW